MFLQSLPVGRDKTFRIYSLRNSESAQQAIWIIYTDVYPLFRLVFAQAQHLKEGQELFRDANPSGTGTEE
jgi:hypothetical protein